MLSDTSLIHLSNSNYPCHWDIAVYWQPVQHFPLELKWKPGQFHVKNQIVVKIYLFASYWLNRYSIILVIPHVYLSQVVTIKIRPMKTEATKISQFYQSLVWTHSARSLCKFRVPEKLSILEILDFNLSIWWSLNTVWQHCWIRTNKIWLVHDVNNSTQ